MVAQCIEQFFYGGVGNFIKKKERVYDEPVRMDGDYKYVDDEESSEGASVTDSMKEEMIKRGLLKEKKYHKKGTGKNALEGIEEKDGDEGGEGNEGEEEDDDDDEEEEDEGGKGGDGDEIGVMEKGGEGALVSAGHNYEDAGLLQLADDGDHVSGPEQDHVIDIEAAGGSSSEVAVGTGLLVNAGGDGDGFEVRNSSHRLHGPDGEQLEVIDPGEKGEGDIETGSYSPQQVNGYYSSFLFDIIYLCLPFYMYASSSWSLG